MKNDQKIPFGKALGYVLLSVLLLSGTISASYFIYHHTRQKRWNDDKFKIVAIAQKSSEPEQLKSVYLAELLELSIDRPTNLYQFDVEKGIQRLLSSSMIESVKIKKIPPGILFVDYVLRKPIAFLGDYTNTALDAEGHLFPFKPFFTPKKLPEIYVGLSSWHDGMEEESAKWGTRLQSPRAQVALKIYTLALDYCSTHQTHLTRIDTSKAYALSYGQRQIVVILEDWLVKEKKGKPIVCTYPKILRLSTERYAQELVHYQILNQRLLQEELKKPHEGDEASFKANPMIIDLRIPQLAFISE
jgi:hypothetical protein